MRFDSAREAGLTEERIATIDDGYEAKLAPREVAALQLTDALIGMPQALDADARAALQAEFSNAEIVELAMGVGLFMSMSKVLICLGLEPEQMDTTVMPTPGS